MRLIPVESFNDFILSCYRPRQIRTQREKAYRTLCILCFAIDPTYINIGRLNERNQPNTFKMGGDLNARNTT